MATIRLALWEARHQRRVRWDRLRRTVMGSMIWRGMYTEWCWDWYRTPYAGGTDPHGAATGSNRVLRGGNWRGYADVARCAGRGRVNPGYAFSYVGFRAVLAPGQ